MRRVTRRTGVGTTGSPVLDLPRLCRTGALLAAAVVVSGLAGRRFGQSEVTPRTR
jgi:hypothetical protein